MYQFYNQVYAEGMYNIWKACVVFQFYFIDQQLAESILSKYMSGHKHFNRQFKS